MFVNYVHTSWVMTACEVICDVMLIMMLRINFDKGVVSVVM